jgi:carbohydrate-selective porin OprB
LRVLGFQNRVTAGAYSEAVAAAAASGGAPNLADVHTARTKRGIGIGTRVAVTENVGAYVRAGWSDGKTETFMFTEIDRSLAAGTLVKGGRWGRPDDTLGLAAYVNGLSRPHRDYLAAGGLGFFLGDGRLNYATESTVESFYSLAVNKQFFLSAGYQRIRNPGYNRDRGPAEVFSLRLHGEI